MRKEIISLTQNQDLSKISDLCLSQFVSSDQGQSGIVKVSDFRKVLLNVTNNGNGLLTDLEIIKICHNLPRDTFGRSLYATFSTVLENVRFNTLMHDLLERRGSHLHKSLIEECKKKEENCYLIQSLKNISTSKFNHTGVLTFRDMLNVLNDSILLSNLTKLQIMILLSEAVILPGNKIDYYSLVPIFAIATEILFDNENYKQKMEIYRTADVFFDMSETPKVTLKCTYLYRYILFHHINININSSCFFLHIYIITMFKIFL